MLSYSKIVQNAYIITIRNPLLWLFGVFVVGGFNLNFLHFQDFSVKAKLGQISTVGVLFYFEQHPEVLLMLSSIVLLVSFLSFLVTNWSRIMLVLITEELLQEKQKNLPAQFKKSWKKMVEVIKMSLLTTGFMVLIAIGLFAPPFFMAKGSDFQLPLFVMAAAIFLPLAFTVSCLNIFSIFFIILFDRKVPTALNLATDFFISNWTQILGLVCILLVIYSVCFVGGIAVIYLVKVILLALWEILGKFGIFQISAIMRVSKTVSSLLLLVLVGGLNVFLNTTLLLLFLQLITPVLSEEKVKKVAAYSAVS